mmetsp:Transcript_28536/g.42003  ORF Transcript_28536/g.42003 Transcript_28536/m.42003 type:complete len:193 (-) Transcript_28536:167-745(-)|eukprot:CAMPEP_0194046112 /NCGR_PEP_ID=MMETSP0009_2-20130614/19564_1 /TAXON_ID=210454 /ORGANISM="Grammatophora oceanica, Strain CCMP 410" /LENGTH=192 /DNA_ID=CAMNT_0038691265 /DNA_START=76 /DNA_END=654 /DNA_ORIENTATION=-
MSSSSSAASAVLLGTATASSIAFSAWFARCANKHGFEGALRTVWEGNPHREEHREVLQTLEETDQLYHDCGDMVERLEDSLEVARLNTIDTDDIPSSPEDRKEDPHLVVPNWKRAHGPRIENELAFSYDGLEKLVKRLDGITAEKDEIREQLNRVAEDLDILMERADALLTFYLKGRENPKTKQSTDTKEDM